MTTERQIITGLASLDPKVDGHWTKDGLPKIDVVAGLVGGKLTRKQITEAAPSFSRANTGSLETPASGSPLPTGAPGSPLPTDFAGSVLPMGDGGETAPDPEDETAPDSEDETAPAPAENPRLAAMRKEYEGLSDEVQELQETRKALDEQIKVLSARQNALEPYVESDSYDHRADQDARMAFIRKQGQLRQARVESSRDLRLALGLTDSMGTKAPIDAAMERKNTRGTQRPTVAPKKG